jgi:hypothetical protein
MAHISIWQQIFCYQSTPWPYLFFTNAVVWIPNSTTMASSLLVAQFKCTWSRALLTPKWREFQNSHQKRWKCVHGHIEVPCFKCFWIKGMLRISFTCEKRKIIFTAFFVWHYVIILIAVTKISVKDTSLFSTLKMKAVISSGMLIPTYENAGCHKQEQYGISSFLTIQFF